MDTMRGALERARMLVGMEVDEESAPEEQSFFDDRLYGFAICLAAGLTCTFLSMLVFFNPVKFGVTFTLGNLMALGRVIQEM
uniref:Vesicle transport protein n=1 Tax=Oryza meridionalis TaxID=40149 RepID=A0A0E0CM55_9ORYZ